MKLIVWFGAAVVAVGALVGSGQIAAARRRRAGDAGFDTRPLRATVR